MFFFSWLPSFTELLFEYFISVHRGEHVANVELVLIVFVF